MNIPGLSQANIESHADASSVDRGRQYFESGAVKSLKRTSDREVEAYVQGSDIAPYHVELRHDENGIVAAACTCPYVSGSWCRHIVAALLAAMDTDRMQPRSLDEMIADLSRGELIDLVTRLVDGHPEVAPLLEEECRRLNGS